LTALGAAPLSLFAEAVVKCGMDETAKAVRLNPRGGGEFSGTQVHCEGGVLIFLGKGGKGLERWKYIHLN
jgi:hypothetical protein